MSKQCDTCSASRDHSSDAKAEKIHIPHFKSPMDWRKRRIVDEEITKYMDGDHDFINDEAIWDDINKHTNPDPQRVRDIIAKSRAIETLSSEELATLINVKDSELWEEMKQAAHEIKLKVYDNRIVTFAPLYLGNHCVNNCIYCGIRQENECIQRKHLNDEELRREIEILAGKIGHKRLIIVYGEHPDTDIEYMAHTMQTIYDVSVPTRGGEGAIRRVNVNCPPLPVDELRVLEQVGLGTVQVFQETYHHETYAKLHPKGTIKANYRWRLYNMHRALEAGIDDVGIGALFGLYDWRFEMMGLLHHAIELEKKFVLGPHTVSFPRIEPAANTPFVENSKYAVSDDDMEKIIVLTRLAMPYTGMILTCRESPAMRRRLLPLGVTQVDASSRIGVGAYQESYDCQDETRQQFLLADDRSLDEVVYELTEQGHITSFCTAGYRCGRTGTKIMNLLRSGTEGKFCKLNAVLTFREWLDDFASEKTRAAGEKLIAREIEEVRQRQPRAFDALMKYYERTRDGERDLCF